MATLTEAIARDILAEKPAAVVSPACFACGRSYSKAAPLADGSGPSRFCSVRCRDAFDAGFPPYDPQSQRSVLSVPLTSWVTVAGPPGTVGRRPYARDLPVNGSGCLIPCRSCRPDFVSKGLRCCSVECERSYREREEIARTAAEVGMESTGYVKRKCEQCGGAIPRYTGVGKARKETRKDARFCSPKCQQRAAKNRGMCLDSQTPVLNAIGAQKPASNGHSEIPVEIPSTSAERSVVTVPVNFVGGGSFRFGDTPIDPAIRRTVIAVETRTEPAGGALPMPQAEEAAA